MPLPGGRGRAGERGERLQRCLVGAGAAVSLIWGSGMRVQAGAATSLRLPRYHPGRRGGGGEPGTAEPTPERDANPLSWEKVNKGHAPCRRPAGAHPRLRPPRVHFHSLSASPPPDSRAALEEGAAPDPARSPDAGAAHPLHSPGKGVPHPSK